MGESERKRCREEEEVVEVGPAHSKQRREVEESPLPQEEEESEQLLDETHLGLVSDVMRSLEEELVGISSSCSGSSNDEDDDDDDEERCVAVALSPAAAAAGTGVVSSPSSSSQQRLDFGFLLEASDDELGIEPAVSCSEEDEDVEEQRQAVVEADDLVRGESWSDGDWSVACSSLPDALFVEEQDWLWKRMLTSSCSSLPMFEAATPLLIL